MTNSVIALNTAGTSGADVAETGTPSTLTAGHSFFGTTVGIDTDNGGNINGGGDPLLGALADNGGAVATRSPLGGSPLINAGDNASLPLDVNDVDHDGNTSEGLPLDARGEARIYQATVDIGAVELQNVAPVAHNDGFATDEATNVNGDVTANNGNGADSDANGDTLTVTKVDGAAFSDGVAFALASGAMLTMHGDGTFTYDSNDVFDFLPVGNVGHDSFTYTVADGNGGTDTATVTIDITGLDTNDTFIGTPGPDVFSGGVGNDTMIGKGGKDKLKGDSGNDGLDGSGGKDKLNGGLGDDTLTGGKGGDAFVFKDKLGATNVDTITDFGVGHDVIDLAKSIFKGIGGKGELNAKYFATGHAKDGNDHIIYKAGKGKLFYDHNGDKAGGLTLFAKVAPHTHLNHTDFLVI